MHNEINDPYQILEIPYWATEKEIQQAFQKKIKEANDSQRILQAYGKIRDTNGRNKIRWDEIETCLASPSSLEDRPNIEIEAIVKELAFRTAWELGDDECLKK